MHDIGEDLIMEDNKEYELTHVEATLQEVMNFYAHGFKLKNGGNVYRFQFFINPINNKVMFELFIRNQVKEVSEEKTVKTGFGDVTYNSEVVKLDTQL